VRQLVDLVEDVGKHITDRGGADAVEREQPAALFLRGEQAELELVHLPRELLAHPPQGDGAVPDPERPQFSLVGGCKHVRTPEGGELGAGEGQRRAVALEQRSEHLHRAADGGVLQERPVDRARVRDP